MAQESTLKDPRMRIAEPRGYYVVFHNDDFTPMDFVVAVLVKVFRKSPDEANALMMAVHRIGKAIVGTYPLDIAASRARRVVVAARSEGFPLVVTVEAE